MYKIYICNICGQTKRLDETVRRNGYTFRRGGKSVSRDAVTKPTRLSPWSCTSAAARAPHAAAGDGAV